MTTIVGLQKGNKVYIAGDRQGSRFGTKATYMNPKVFKKGDFIFGSCGTWRTIQILQYRFNPPEFNGKDDKIYEYMATEFADELIKVFKDNGYAENDKDVPSIADGEFIVGFRGKLFEVHSNFQICERLDNFIATGSGCFLALGSLYALDRYVDMSPEDMLICSLAAANKYDLYTDGEYDIVSV